MFYCRPRTCSPSFSDWIPPFASILLSKRDAKINALLCFGLQISKKSRKLWQTFPFKGNNSTSKWGKKKKKGERSIITGTSQLGATSWVYTRNCVGNC